MRSKRQKSYELIHSISIWLVASLTAFLYIIALLGTTLGAEFTFFYISAAGVTYLLLNIFKNLRSVVRFSAVFFIVMLSIFYVTSFSALWKLNGFLNGHSSVGLEAMLFDFINTALMLLAYVLVNLLVLNKKSS